MHTIFIVTFIVSTLLRSWFEMNIFCDITDIFIANICLLSYDFVKKSRILSTSSFALAITDGNAFRREEARRHHLEIFDDVKKYYNEN